MSLLARIRAQLTAAGHFLLHLVTAPLRGLQDLTHLSGQDEWEPDSRQGPPSTKRPSLLRRIGWTLAGLGMAIWSAVAGIVLYITAPGHRLRGALLVTMAVVAIGSAIFGARMLATPAEQKLAMIEQDASAALASGDLAKAQEGYLRLSELRPTEPRYPYHLALIKQQQGSTADAFELMRQLAPTDSVGYVPAHRWLVAQLLAARSDEFAELKIDPAARRRVLRHHVESVLKSDANDPEMLLLKAEFDKSSAPQAALAIFQRLSRQHPRLLFQVAELQRQLEQPDEARKTIEKFNQDLEQRLASGDYEQNEVVDYVATTLMIGDYDRADESLQRYGAALEERQVSTFRAQILLALGARDFESGDEALQDRGLQRIAESIRLMPENAEAYKLLGLYAGMHPSHPPRVIEVCQNLIQTDLPTSDVHLLLGGLLLGLQQFDEAERVLAMGLSVQPNSAELLNNLAWLEANRPDGDLERAKQLSDRSLELKQSNPSFYETRGSILMKQGQLNEALADFERAMQGMPNSETLLEECADVYQQLGFESQAQAYRSRLEAVRKQKAQQ